MVPKITYSGFQCLYKCTSVIDEKLLVTNVDTVFERSRILRSTAIDEGNKVDINVIKFFLHHFCKGFPFVLDRSAAENGSNLKSCVDLVSLRNTTTAVSGCLKCIFAWCLQFQTYFKCTRKLFCIENSSTINKRIFIADYFFFLVRKLRHQWHLCVAEGAKSGTANYSDSITKNLFICFFIHCFDSQIQNIKFHRYHQYINNKCNRKPCCV